MQKLCLDDILLLCAAPERGCLGAQTQLGYWLRESRAATDSSCSGGCVWGVSKQEVPWMRKCMRVHAPASSSLSCCPLAALHYWLMRFSAPKGHIPVCTQPVLLCSRVWALGSTNVGCCDLLPAWQEVEADRWRQPLVYFRLASEATCREVQAIRDATSMYTHYCVTL